jgi:hypothetical protein
MTDVQQTQQPYQPQAPYQAQPPRKKHTVRNILLILVLMFVLGVGGCMALIAGAANEADKALKGEAANDRPTSIAAGKAFEHDGFALAGGWKVQPERFGGATIKGLTVTLKDDQETPSRSALLTFRLYNGKTVVSEIECSSNEMQQGETSGMDCISLDSKKIGKWDTIKVSDMF